MGGGIPVAFWRGVVVVEVEVEVELEMLDEVPRVKQ